MNLDRIIQMVINTVIRQLVHRGVNAGMSQVNKKIDEKSRRKKVETDAKATGDPGHEDGKMRRMTQMFRRF